MGSKSAGELQMAFLKSPETPHAVNWRKRLLSSRVAEPENLKTVPVPTFHLNTVPAPVRVIYMHIHIHVRVCIRICVRIRKHIRIHKRMLYVYIYLHIYLYIT